MDRSPSALNWDIFCKVIDNFGDVGVCWRLARDLASRGHAVRLWIDDASALAWMAPGGCERVQVLPWTPALDLANAALAERPAEVLVEAFGCEVPDRFLAACAESDRRPVWINLEYLSAEPYVERSHALPSPVFTGPAADWTKWFFYPGFTAHTGGLLREPGVAERRAAFDSAGWLAGLGLANPARPPEKRILLFCYEPPALAALLRELAGHGLGGEPVRLLVASGRPARAVRALVAGDGDTPPGGAGLLSISYLPLLSQDDFDRVLWSCDLNFVRGEDSVVRAVWAGKPFVWQIYPQDDGVHTVKLDAFLDMLDAPPSLRNFHHRWNAAQAAPDAAMAGLAALLPDWSQAVQAARTRLEAGPDLVTRLLNFVRKNR